MIRPARVRTALLAGALALALTGCLTACQKGTDDELAQPPTRTITATPSPSLSPAPATIPVGDGKVAPGDVVWAQGSVLHVGTRTVDLTPIEIDALVVVPGGVFVLNDGELWFTDLSRIRGTGQTEITHVRVNADASRLVVTDTRSGHPLDQGYDTATGRALRGKVVTLSPQQQVEGPGTTPGPDLPFGTRVGRWLSDSAFLATGYPRRPGPLRVLRCEVGQPRCQVVGSPHGKTRVVFGTGK